jgi:hypothetical protein
VFICLELRFEKSIVLTEAERRTRPNATLLNDSLLAFRLPPADNHTLHYNTQRDTINICSKFRSNCRFCPLWTQLYKIFNCKSGYILNALENLLVEYYSISS